MEKQNQGKTDRRISKTKRAIRGALLHLMTEKEVEKITIKEVAELADVDRKTVYNYYDGVHSILDELENELMAGFEKAMENVEYGVENVYILFEALTNYLTANWDVCETLMKMEHNSRFIFNTIDFLHQKILLAIENLNFVPSDKQRLCASFITMGLFSVYREWFNSDRKQSLEELSKDVGCLVLNGLFSYL
jgi:AcrR family transcriptional regulator